MTMIAEAKRTVSNIVSQLLIKEPFLGMALRKTTIILVKDDDRIAYTDGMQIYVSPQWLKLPNKDKAFALIHELLHIIMLHVPRMTQLKTRYPLPDLVYNVIMDAKANQEIEAYATGLTFKPIMPEDVQREFQVERVREKSLEEIIREIYEKYDTTALPIPDVQVDLVPEGKEEGEVIQEGDESIKKMSNTEIEREIARKITEVLITLKMIGKDPGKWERVLSELLKPKVDWRRLLRTALVKGLGRDIRRTWTRPSRKLPVYPGKELMSHGKVVTLVDTSASIGEEELIQFMSEVYAAAKETGRVVAVIWDATVQQEFEIRRYTDIRKLKVRGGGGTLIKPALEHVLQKHKDAMLYTILSDWEIGDLDEASNLLEKIARKTVAVTTHRDPPSLPFYAVIRI